MNTEAEVLAKKIHDWYEELSQKKCKIAFEDLPLQNKTVMIKVADKILRERRIFVEEGYSVGRSESYDSMNKILNEEIKKHEKKVEELINWGDSEQKNNNIYGKSTDELNDDWIEKIKKEFGVE